MHSIKQQTRVKMATVICFYGPWLSGRAALFCFQIPYKIGLSLLSIGKNRPIHSCITAKGILQRRHWKRNWALILLPTTRMVLTQHYLLSSGSKGTPGLRCNWEVSFLQRCHNSPDSFFPSCLCQCMSILCLRNLLTNVVGLYNAFQPAEQEMRSLSKQADIPSL